MLLVRQGWCGVVGCPCCVVTQVDDPPTPVTNYSNTLVARSTLVSTLVPWSGGAAGSPGLRATAKVPWSGDLPIPRRVRGSLEVCRSPEVRWSQETPLLLLVHGDVEVDEDEELEDEDEGGVVWEHRGSNRQMATVLFPAPTCHCLLPCGLPLL